MITKQLVPYFITLAILSSHFSAMQSKAENECMWLGGGAIVVGGFGCWIHQRRCKADAEAKQAEIKADQQARSLQDALKKSIVLTEKHSDILNHTTIADPSNHKLSEQFVASYSPQFPNKNSSLQTSIDALSQAISIIEAAINNEHNDQRKNELTHTMQQQEDLRRRLELAQQRVKTCESYHDVKNRYNSVKEKYARSLALLASHPELKDHKSTNPAPQSSIITVLNLYSEKSQHYPHLIYAQESSRDIKQLDQLTNEIALCYPKLAEQTQGLMQQITTFYHLVINSTGYQNDVQAHKQDQREREKFEIQQSHYRKIEAIETARLQEEQSRGATERNRLNIEQGLAETLHKEIKSLQIKQAETAEQLDCLKKITQATKEDIARVYVQQNTQEQKMSTAEHAIRNLQSHAEHMVRTKQKPPACEEQAPPPYSAS